MPNNTGRTSSTFLLGSQKVTIHEPENINGWTFAVLQRKFWLIVRDISLVTFWFYNEHIVFAMGTSRPEVKVHCFEEGKSLGGEW